ncbi:hypothetical protein C9374_010195 [Naegleria lovaniensis]|uniref:Csf1 N-terminal domain-containing protein n=1 Tax=Naegleria lovaniensis TaxID=51637 RepID=A0AA88GEQ1_NAELO|nr:uncharacterized protein C9374_010195 [Naegleria lovaniensis]KAG2375191.1 hypothetical protein C9374_010195 [Naegleria lovaniensis]
MALSSTEISSLVVFVICALVLMAFIVIYVLFSSRIFAWAICKLAWYWKLKTLNEYLSIGSLTFSPLGGKILFRNVQYTTKNGSLHIIDGYIEIYWWFILTSTWQKSKKESRFRCYLNGVEWLIYNNVSRYDQINSKKLNYNLSDSDGEEGDRLHNDDRIHDTEDEGHRDILEEDNIQKFFTWAKAVGVDIRRGCVAIGNSELPVSVRIAFRRAISTIYLDKPACNLDKYKLVADINFEYIKVMFIENTSIPQYNTPHFELSRKKVEEDIIKEVQKQFKSIFKNSNFDFMNELKTMASEKIEKQPEYVFNLKEIEKDKSANVDETKVCLCTKLRVSYYYEEGGVIPEEPTSPLPPQVDASRENPTELAPPSHGVELHFDRFVDGAIVYGPWGDHQRALLQAFFFPPLYENAKYYRKTSGRQRRAEKFDVEFYFMEKTTWMFPFIRTPKTLKEKKENKGNQEVLTMIFEKNSFLHWSGDMFASLTTNETVTNIDFNFPGMTLVTSNTKVAFGEAEIGKGHFVLKNSAEWNGKREWIFNLEANKSTVYYTAEHIGFIMDIIRDWRNYPNQKPPTLLDFIPSVYTYNFYLYNSTLKMHTNELNIVEHPNDPSHNHFFCITYPLMAISFTAPSEIFSPSAVEYTFSVEIKGDSTTDPGVHMEYPANHPIFENSNDPSRKFLWGERAYVHGSYTVHEKIHADNVDCCMINIDLFNVNLLVNGYYINYLITMWFDHFTAERFWMTTAEFKSNGFKNDKSKQINNLQSTDLNSIPFSSNITEYVVNINIKRGKVHLPHSLYSSDECTQLMGEEFSMDIRYVPASVDLCFSLGQMMAEIPMAFDERTRQSKKFVGCEGIKFNAQIPMGPNPDGLTWRRKLHFDIGALSGEITPSQIGNVVNFLLNFVYQWRLAYYPKPEMAFKKADYSRRQYSEEEFDECVIWDIRVTFVSIFATISMANGLVQLDVDKGLEITFDTLNNGSSNSRFNLVIPTIHARAMHAREMGMKMDGDWIQVGELLTGLSVGMAKRTHDLREHYFRQQKFIQNMNGDGFDLQYNMERQHNLLNRSAVESGSSKKRSKRKNLSKRSFAKSSTEISETDASETDTDEFYDIADEEDEEEELKEENDRVFVAPKTIQEEIIHYENDHRKEISTEYIDNLIHEDNCQTFEKESLDARSQWNLISKSFPSMSTYSAYLNSYNCEFERESLAPTSYTAKNFLEEKFPYHRLGMYSPFPEIRLLRHKQLDKSEHKDYLPLASKYSKLNMTDFRGQFYSFATGKDRENIQRILQIESQLNAQENVDIQHVNIEFLKNVDISLSPNVIPLLHNLVKYIILPDSNLHATADHIEKSQNIFKQEVAEELLNEKKVKPTWDKKRIVFSGGVKCVNVNVIQSISVPNIIQESPVQGMVGTYSLKLFATDALAGCSVTLKYNDKKNSSELYSIEGFGKCLELGGVAQCVDMKKNYYKGVDTSELPHHFLQRCNLSADAPVVALVSIQDIHFQGKNNIKEENSQGRFTCTVGRQGAVNSGVTILVTHDIVVIGYSTVEVWRKVITDMVLNIKNYVRLRHVYDLLLLSQISKTSNNINSINDDSGSIPVHGVLEKKQAIKHLRKAICALSLSEAKMMHRHIANHVHIKVDPKKEMRDVRNEYSELIEEDSATAFKQTKSASIELRTDISFHLQRLSCAVHSTDYKTKISTKSIAKVEDILVRGKVEHGVYSLFDSGYKHFEESTQKIREVSLILSINCKEFSIDVHSQTLLLLTSALGVFLIVKNKPFIKNLREKERKKATETVKHKSQPMLEVPSKDDVSASHSEMEHVEKELPVSKDSITLKLHVFTNVHVEKAAARAWMDKGSYAELSIDNFSFSFNQPKQTEEQMLAITSESVEESARSTNKSCEVSSVMQHSGNISVNKILFQFNYSTPEKTSSPKKEFISLFDVTVSDIRLNEFMSKAQENLHIHTYFTFDKLLINLPFADVWSASSVQFRNFVKTWYEAVARKPNLPPFNIEKEKSATEPTKDKDSKTLSNFSIPSINVVADLNDVSAYFKLVNAFQMRYALSKLTLNFNQTPTLENNFMVHLFPNSFTLKSNNDEEFPPSNKWEGPNKSSSGVNEFKKQFLLPELIISGSLKNQQVDEASTKRILSMLIAIDYMENVVTSDLLNHVIVIQSAVAKEVNKIVESLNINVEKEDLEKIKTELPKAKKNVSSLNLALDVNILFDGIRITALGPSTALVVDSGSIFVNANTLENMKVKATLKGLNVNMIDTHNIKWGNTRKFKDRYSDISDCYQWAQFRTNLQIQNFLDTPLSQSSKSDESTRNFTVDIFDTHLYLRPGCIEQGLFLFKDYKQSMKTLFEKLKESRQKYRSEALTSLIKTGEQYYSMYSHQIKEKVTSDASTFINSGVVRITNTTLSMPFGDNPFYGFLTNSGPTYRPACCLQVIIPAIGFSTMSESEDDVSATLDTIISTGKDSVSSQRVATGKVLSVNIYLDEKPARKPKQSFNMPSLGEYEVAKTKAKVEKIIMSLKLKVTKNEINGSGVLHIPGPELRISPSLIRRGLELGYDWFNPKRKLFATEMISGSEIPTQKPETPRQGESMKIRDLTRRKFNFLFTANIQPGVFTLAHNLTPSTIIRRKLTDDTSISVEEKLPSISATALHKNPGTSTNRSTTHVHVEVNWDGIKLMPKSIFFILETLHEFKLWKKEENKRRSNSSSMTLEDLLSESDTSKPVAWMKMIKALLLIQRVYRGHRARKLFKKLKNNKTERDNYLKKSVKKESKKREAVTLQSDSFSLQCRIHPFKLELSCFPLAETATSLEFVAPFDIMMSRTLRSVQTGSTRGNAMYMNLFMSCPSVIVRCYHPLTPTPFIIATVKGIIGNVGSGFGSYLRSDDTPVYSGTIHVKKISLEVSLPQMNHFFIMYTIWMDKYEEAKNALKVVRGEIVSSPKLITPLPVTSEEQEEKEQKRKKISMDEISLNSTASKFGQLLISSFEIVSDMGPTLGKQKFVADEISLFCKDKGRIQNETVRDPLHIGGYIGKLEGKLVGRLQGNILMHGVVAGINRSFKVGGPNPTYKGVTELSLTALPSLIDIELNSAKILNISLKTLSLHFSDVFDSSDGRMYHVETEINSSGAIVRLSKISASAFIYVFYKIKELASEKKRAALDTLQGSVSFFNFDSKTSDHDDTDDEDEKPYQIKSLTIQSPTKQFLSLVPMGDIVFKGANLRVYLYEKFSVENDKFNPNGDWLEFGMDDYQLKFKRKALVEDKSVERSLTLFLAKVVLDRMAPPTKRSFILEVPGAHLTMNSVQTRALPDIINYTFKTKFPKAITVTTNLNEYTFLQGLLKLYKNEVKNELDEHQKSSSQGATGTIISLTSPSLNDQTSSQKKTSNIFGISKRHFEGTVQLNPKLNVLGDLTPEVQTVLGWLGISESIIPQVTHEGVTDTLETILIACYRTSELMDRIFIEQEK